MQNWAKGTESPLVSSAHGVDGVDSMMTHGHNPEHDDYTGDISAHYCSLKFFNFDIDVR